MPDIKIYQDEQKAKQADQGVPSWTFSVDGQASGYWCTSEYVVKRVVGRLNQGKSREAFGGGLVAQHNPATSQLQISQNTSSGRGKVFQQEGKPQQQTVTLKGGQKLREVPQPWQYELDGVVSEQTYKSEREARVACAWHAFMTRGKLGRLKEAEEAFEQQHGCKATVTYDGKSVLATKDDGTQHAVGITVGQPIRFKQLGANQNPVDALYEE